MAEATFKPLGTKPDPGHPLFLTKSIEDLLTQLPTDLIPVMSNLHDWISGVAGNLVANIAVTVISSTITLIDLSAESVGAIIGYLDAYREQGRLAAYALVTPNALSPGDVATMFFRGLKSQEEFFAEVKRNGISADRASGLLAAARPILDVGSIQELQRRGFINPVRAIEGIQAHGYFPNVAQQIAALSSTIYGAPEILAAYKRTLLTAQQATFHLGKTGVPKENAPLLLSLARELLTPQDIVTSWLREDITRREMDKNLEEHGYDSFDRDQIRNLAFFIPAIPDLVRFAVREAFSPAQVKALDLDEEFPEDFGKWAKKQGVSSDWAHKFWQSHWELPSPTQAFEMFHRTTHTRLDPTSPVLGNVKGKPYYRVISEGTLKNLLKAQDYAPTWRGKMQEISYGPLTRVDIRRMYELGFLDKDGVRKAYHDDGYSPENVERITNFVEADVYDNYAGKVKVQLLTQFRRGIISQAQLEAYLKKAKVPPNFIKALVEAEIELREAEQLEKHVKALERQYKRGFLTESKLQTSLETHKLSSETVQHLVSLWRSEKLAATNRISVKDLKKAQIQGLVDDAKMRSELQERNWQADDIEIMVKLKEHVDPEPPEVAP